jgi:hypothetical protein
VRFFQNSIRSNTGSKSAFVVRITFQEIFIDARKRLFGNLRAPWVVKENCWSA